MLRIIVILENGTAQTLVEGQKVGDYVRTQWGMRRIVRIAAERIDTRQTEPYGV